MFKSVFTISKMDCPSEESLIRMKLEGLSTIKSLVFDIENRKLTVFHSEENEEIEKMCIRDRKKLLEQSVVKN